MWKLGYKVNMWKQGYKVNIWKQGYKVNIWKLGYKVGLEPSKIRCFRRSAIENVKDMKADTKLKIFFIFKDHVEVAFV